MIPVAASGNLEYPHGPKKYVYAPANIPEVVAVGGCETICPKAQADVDPTETTGPYRFEDDSNETAFCSTKGCVDGTPCVRNSSTRAWSGNTKPLDEKPDILAPAHFPTRASTNSIDDVNVAYGTSFAAPVVAGTIGKVLAEIDLSSTNIIPYLPQLIANSGSEVDQYPAKKLDAFNFLKQAQQLSPEELAE